MSRTIHVTLSEKSIKKAIEDIERYSLWVKKKTSLLVEKLSDIGIETIDDLYNSGKGEYDANHNTYAKFKSNGSRSVCTIVCEGTDLLFIEFGAGITYNQNDSHPKESEFRYGVGTYPGQTHAFDPNGWVFEKNGYPVHTYGTQMTMPMYNAYQTIVDNVKNIAKEVFET